MIAAVIMNLSKKNLICLPALLAVSVILFFLLDISPVSAAGCQGNQEQSRFSSYFNPFISFAEKVVKNFGFEITLAAAPDPDFCGSDSVGCSGMTPTATVFWERGPIGYSFYHLVALNSGWTFCANGGGVCSFSGTKVVRYGADSCGYVYGNFTDSVSCTGSYGNPGPFGASDPCPNIYKHCDFASGLDFKISSINTISYAISSGLANNTLYNWLVEAYLGGGYGYYPSKYLGYSNQPYGSFRTSNCAPPPAVTLTANGVRPQIKIVEGWSVNLNWTSTGVTSCTASVSTPNDQLDGASDWNGAKPVSDSSADYTYTLTDENIYTFSIQCTGPNGSAESSVNVDVVRPILTLERGSQTCLAVNLDWSWNDSFFNNEYSQYRVLRSDDGLVFSERAIVNAPIMTYQDQDTFISDQTYHYQIEALKPGFPSVVSNTIQTIPCPRLPGWEEIRPR